MVEILFEQIVAMDLEGSAASERTHVQGHREAIAVPIQDQEFPV